MATNNEGAEQLLESLIKMVGKANQKVDSLQKRVGQLELLIREHEFEVKEKDPIAIYPPSHFF